MVSSTDSALSRRIDDALLHEYESAIAASTRMRQARVTEASQAHSVWCQ